MDEPCIACDGDYQAKIAGVRKIAVLRSNGVGDFIFSLPALEALRASYPKAEITLLGRPWVKTFLTGRPGPIDRVLAVPPFTGVNDEGKPVPEEQMAFFAAMQAEGFDLALQLHGGGRHSNPFVKRLGARVTAGLKAPEAEALDRWVPYIYFQSEPIRYLEVVTLVGATPVNLTPRLEVTAADRLALRDLLPEGRPTVVIHPGASEPRRRWPARRFAATADALALSGYRIVLNATIEESVIAEQIRAAMRLPAFNVAGRLNLGGLSALLQESALVISNDSGPLHIATAVGTPSVGLFWFPNLMTASPLFRSAHRPLISWRQHCPRCGQEALFAPCSHPESFLEDITVEDVLAASGELLRFVPHAHQMRPAYVPRPLRRSRLHPGSQNV